MTDQQTQVTNSKLTCQDDTHVNIISSTQTSFINTKVHRMFCFVSIFLYSFYYWVCLVDPFYDWFSKNLAFVVDPISPVSTYFRRNIAVFCFFMAFDMYEKLNYTEVKFLYPFYLRQFVGWAGWIVINATTLSSGVFQLGLGIVHILLCVFQFSLLGISLIRAKRLLRYV
jgi:hypothetical protein